MGSTLTNTQPKDTYKSLLKTSDSSELSATAKYVSDGNGNDSPLALSTAGVGIGTTSSTLFGTSGFGRVLGVVASSGYATVQIGGASGEGGEIDLGAGSIRHGAVASLNGSHLAFFTNATNSGDGVAERMRITSGGYVRLASGTLGIQFNGDNAAANALDDYEEGTWTPQISNGTTNVAISNSHSVYTKIGNKVTVNTRTVNGDLSSFSSGDIISFVGLPFTSSNDTYGTMYIRGAASGDLLVYAFVTNGTTRVGTTTTVSSLVSGNSDYWFTITYYV